MTTPLQNSINIKASGGASSFDDAVIAPPYQAPPKASFVSVNNAAAAVLELPTAAQGASIGQQLVVQQSGAGTLTVNAAVPFPMDIASGQTAQLIATDDGAGGIAWVQLSLV